MAGALAVSGCTGAYFAALNAGPSRGIETSTRVYDPEHELALDVYRPQACQGDCPAVVFYYGGHWRTGSRAQYAFVGRALARRGVVGVVADYRLYPKVRFPEFAYDAAKAAAWVRANAGSLGAAASRVYVAGHSAGAHLAALIATDGRYLAAADSTPRALAGVIGIAGPYDFLPMDADIAPAFGAVEGHPATQPVNHVDGDEPRFLLLHGTADRSVWPRNSERLAAKLRRRGVDVTLKRYDDVGHVKILTAIRLPSLAPTLDDLVAFVRAQDAG